MPTRSLVEAVRPLKKLTAKSVEVPPDEFLTTQELMRLLKIKHKHTIYRLIDEGLPAIVVGKNFRFIKNEVINFLRNGFSKKLQSKSR